MYLNTTDNFITGAEPNLNIGVASGNTPKHKSHLDFIAGLNLSSDTQAAVTQALRLQATNQTVLTVKQAMETARAVYSATKLDQSAAFISSDIQNSITKSISILTGLGAGFARTKDGNNILLMKRVANVVEGSKLSILDAFEALNGIATRKNISALFDAIDQKHLQSSVYNGVGRFLHSGKLIEAAEIKGLFIHHMWANEYSYLLPPNANHQSDTRATRRVVINNF